MKNTLIRNGYSFFPEKFSFYAYSYIIRQGEKIPESIRNYHFCNHRRYRCKTLRCPLCWHIRFRLKSCRTAEQLPFFVFFTMLFNGGLVPTYLMYVKYFHIKNTIWALIVPGFLLSANNVLMIRSYFNTSIPDALFGGSQDRWRRTHENFHQHHTAAWKTDSGNHGTVFRTWLLE